MSLQINIMENLPEEDLIIVDKEFNKYAEKNGVVCDYTPFAYVASDDNTVMGFITGHSYYKEVHIGDLIVYEEFRDKKIGTKLVEEVIERFKNKGFENINLTTYEFQAPEFYKKCGFEVEYVRKSKENSKLNKYFMVKYL